MTKPPAPDTIHLHLPEPTGRDAHDSPFWRIGPILILVGVITTGDETGRHGVFVDNFGSKIPAGQSVTVAAAIVAADRAAQVANTRAIDAQLERPDLLIALRRAIEASS